MGPRIPSRAGSSLPEDALIQLDGVRVSLGGPLVLDNISLDIGRGEVVCVVGPSGCGKTTLLRLIGGLISPTAGSCRFEGRDIGKPRRDIAIVFQDYGRALLPWRTAAGNIELALDACKIPRAQWAATVERLLKTMGLTSQGGKYPRQMSGGMQQRLQIARCLAQEPAAILMDEPFGALDAMTRQSLQDEVLAIVRERRTTVFFVTHDLEEAIYLGDRVIGLLPRPGRIGSIFEVRLSKPRNQLATREDLKFLQLRRELFEFIEGAEH